MIYTAALALVVMLAGSGHARPDDTSADPALTTTPVSAQLLSSVNRIANNGEAWFGLKLETAPGWHTYWLNPGDSGLGTTLDWQLPAGVIADPLQFPVPQRFKVGAFTNYGYNGSIILPVKLHVSQPPAASALALKAHATWLACAQVCIPGEADLSLDLPVGAGGVTTPDAKAIEASVAQVPQMLAEPIHAEATTDQVMVALPLSVLNGATPLDIAFYPDTSDFIDTNATETWKISGDKLELTLPRLPPTKINITSLPANGELAGVLSITTATQNFNYRIAPKLNNILPVATGKITATPVLSAASPGSIGAPPVTSQTSLISALAFAFLGGLILNLMPCVLPILTLKAFGIVRQGGTNFRHRAIEGSAYTAGVLLSFLAIAGALLALRAGGAAIGWGFQLQSPIFVGALAYFLFALGLSLSGVFDIGSSLQGVGGSLTQGNGRFAAFGTGVLAVIVATPCTAPFMGVALGYALTQPVALSLAVFVALGLGLAAPFALVTLVPQIARALPKPGAWMETLKQLLAFPIYATVAWLIWVMSFETSAMGLALALAGLVLIGFAAWGYGRFALASPVPRRIALASVGIALLLSIISLTKIRGMAANATPIAASDATMADITEAFTATRLSEAAAAHRPTLVDMGAAWCLTCLVNENTVLKSATIEAAFKAKNALILHGDWTRQDPVITQYLASFGRTGVPLYVFYPNNAENAVPMVLPQILTEGALLAALNNGASG